jgi:hypothetical protein
MCFFCIAVFAVLVGAVTTVVLDQLEQRLATVAADGRVNRVTDSGSTAVFALDVPVPRLPGQPAPTVATAPVAVTVFKTQKRVRIQVRTHAVTPAQAEAIQDRLAHACGLIVVSRSAEQTRHIVHQAVNELAASSAESGPVLGPPQTRPER